MSQGWSADQTAAIEMVRRWWEKCPIPFLCEGCTDGKKQHIHGQAHAYPVMCVGGLAGTGKTFVAAALAEALGVTPTFVAPTHKAAAVLRGKLGGVVGTYHALIYKPSEVFRCRASRVVVHVDPDHECQDGDECTHPDRFTGCGAAHECVLDQEPVFTRRTVLAGVHELIVVDEASMLTAEQVADVRAFGIPVLLIGDHGQLPPVKAGMNPWMSKPDAVLTVNHRQGEGSGIVALAHAVRAGGRPTAGQDDRVAVLDAKTHPEAVRGLLERFTPDADRALIVWRNQTRVALNMVMRGHGGPPTVGDRVVCLRGVELPTADHGDPVYVHNGALGTISAVHASLPRLVRMDVALDGGDVVTTQAATAQFDQPESMAYNDPWRPRGRDWQSWDYGYAITAHKAQGSEFSDVIVIDENPRDYPRWMYTAITRAAKRLVVVTW